MTTLARLSPALLIAACFALFGTGCNQAELDPVDYDHYTGGDEDEETGGYDSNADEGADHDSEGGVAFGNEAGAPAFCGDGVLDGFEECDEGEDNADYAACTSQCVINVCGDGLVYEGVEECDEGEDNGGGLCREDCTLDGPE